MGVDGGVHFDQKWEVASNTWTQQPNYSSCSHPYNFISYHKLYIYVYMYAHIALEDM